MKQYALLLFIFFWSCQSILQNLPFINSCGDMFLMHGELCFWYNIEKGNYKQSKDSCFEKGLRLPKFEDLKHFCESKKKLPSFKQIENKPDVKDEYSKPTTYWTLSESNESTKRLTLTFDCKQEMDSVDTVHYYLCIKDAPKLSNPFADGGDD